ncbi:MAG: putative transposase [Actinomycetota bacterium]|nr:putative transposase [Actinomycetota bacterium]
MWDATITEVRAGYYQPDQAGRRPPEALYGSLKMWEHLNRSGIPVARCQSERLMRVHGWQGVRRAKKVRTTLPDPAAARAADLVNRQFRAGAPSELVAADFTYVPLAAGTHVYTAFVIDVYAGLITGWACSASRHTRFVQDAITEAAAFRARQANPLTGKTIHHSDAGSQDTSIKFGESLMLAGMIGLIGSVGDAFDNALAETTIGLYKTECIRADSPFRTGPLTRLADVEAITAAWYNNHRLMHRLGRRPPAEYEAAYYANITDRKPACHT